MIKFLTTTYMNNNIPVATERRGVQTGVRVPEDMWKRVKRVAVELDTTAQQIVIDALTALLPKLERKVR